MPFRKPYPKRTRRRYAPKKSFNTKVKKVIKRTHKPKQLRGEMVASMTTLTAGASWNFHDITNMVKGNQINQREGDKAHFSGTLVNIIGNNQRDSVTRYVRVVVFREKGFGYFSETNNNLCWDDAFNELNWSGGQGDITAPVNTQNYTVYSDRTFKMSPLAESGSSFHARYFVKHPAVVQYTPLDSGYAIFRSGRIYIVTAISDGAAVAGSSAPTSVRAFTQTYFRDVV